MSRRPHPAYDNAAPLPMPQDGTGGTTSSARSVLPERMSNFAPSSAATPFAPQVRALGNGVPGFKTSFDTSAKGGGAFKAISENFSANPANGTLSLSIPMSVSPGRGGLQPEMALSYNSGGGNGPFGFGWGVSLPSVHRKTNLSVPKYEDKTDGEEDDLAFSGGDIVRQLDDKGSCVRRSEQTSAGEFNVFIYRPRVDTGAMKIEKWVSQPDNSDIHWRIITANNQTSIYGESDSSRIMDTSLGIKRIFSWLLSRSYDAFGNAIMYVYKAEDGSGVAELDNSSLPDWERNQTQDSRCHQKYIKRVKYGNRVPCRDLETWSADTTWPVDWMFELVFDYGEHAAAVPGTIESNPWSLRQDPFSESHAGFEIRNYRICRRILMFHHFLDQLAVAENLVSSTSMNYTESPQRTVLTAVTISGHTIKNIEPTTGTVKEYRSKSMPSWTFQYTSTPPVNEVLTTNAKTYNLLQLPNSQTKVSEWLDLNGEGMPGLLTKFEDGTMLYQRNTGPTSDSDGNSQFMQPSIPLKHPNLINGEFHDLERNGQLNYIVRDETSRPMGFYDRDESDTWSIYSDFPATPSGLDLQRLTDIDLTGDGLADTIFDSGDGKGSLLWQENLGKQGYAAPQQIRLLSSETPQLRPRLVQTPDTRTFVADMTGSGMSDLVEITRSSVRYWPNLGHGLFGAPVDMGTCPLLAARQDGFDFARLRLLDADGSGPTDLLYLHPEEGATLYYNLAGNSWSQGVTISSVPIMIAPSALFALDILGRGTSCLCWANPSGSDINSNKIMYVDLMGPVKPHLLERYSNGLGATTSITYEPSTKYYIDDEKSCLSWTTKLPFPVQCVSSITVIDEVTGHRQITSYVYHNGCYDSVENQFAGFEMVEITESERIVISDSETYEPPATLTKTWFSVGLGMGVEDKQYRTTSNIVSVFDGDLDLNSDCFRALRGMNLRTELYAADDMASSGVRQALQISETASQLRLRQPRGINKFSVAQLVPLETIITQYDQNMSDPRITHTMILKSNAYGDMEESVRFIYPRKNLPADLPPDVSTNQAAGNVTYVTIEYTNDVVEGSNFRKPQAYSQQEFEVLGFPFPASGVLTLDQAQNATFDMMATMKGDSTTPWKELRTQSRASYRDDKLETSLKFGELQAFSVLDRVFNFALDPGLVAKMKLGLATCGVSSDAEDLIKQSGYLNLQEIDVWWTPSSRTFYTDARHDVNSQLELQQARRSFYSPAYAEDSLGNPSWMVMDDDFMLVESVKDALGNTSKFKNDYERLQPVEITDANQNIAKVAYDSLGFPTADATLGKVSATNPEPDADSLDGLVLDPTLEDLEDVLKNPNGVTARRLLGLANSRTFHSPERFSTWKAKSTAQSDIKPSFSIRLWRALPHARSVKTDISVQVTYLSGHGTPYQDFHLNDPDIVDNTWLLSSLVQSDASGRAVCQHQPFYSPSPQFIPPAGLNGVESAMMFYDTLGHPVATLAADATWTKTVQSPWSITMHDAGSQILQAIPENDPDVGYLFRRTRSSRYTPTWSTRKKTAGTAQDFMAVEKSSVYANVVVTTHIGSCGLPVVQRTHNADTTITERRFAYDVNGNKVRDYDSLGRLVEKLLYDKLGRRLQSTNMDSGESWALSDVLGGEFARWNSRGYMFTTIYDKLHREIEKHVQKGSTDTKKLVTRYTYGETNEDADPAANTRRQIWKVEDQAGIHLYTRFDIRAHCVEKSFQATEEYKDVVDWNKATADALMPTVYSRTSRYDSFGQILESKDAEGNRTRNHFTRLGQIDKVDFMPAADSGHATAWKSLVLSATFTADGLPLVTRYGNNAVTTYEYNRQTRSLISQVTTREGRTGADARLKERLEDISHTYDCAGRRVFTSDRSEQSKYFRGNYVKPEQEFTFDNIGRLVAATGRAQLTIASGMRLKPYDAMTGDKSQRGVVDGSQLYQYREKYEYDAEGNIQSLSHAPVSDSTKVTGWTRKYFYEEPSLLDSAVTGNRLSRTTIGTITEGTYVYDGDAGLAGCMTSLPQFSQLDWNFDNMLKFSSTQRVQQEGSTPERTYYVYDYTGKRARKVSESFTSDGEVPRKLKETLFLDGVQLQTKQDKTELWIARVGGSSDQPLAMIEHSSSRKRPLYRLQIGDGMELDEDAKLVSFEEYSPFGSVVYSAMYRDVEAPRVYRFAKYEHDRETGLYHCGKRYYCPWLARWTSPDPMGDVDGPNIYVYVGNDPVSFVDPKGTSRSAADMKAENEKKAASKAKREGTDPKNVIDDGVKRRRTTPLPTPPPSDAGSDNEPDEKEQDKGEDYQYKGPKSAKVKNNMKNDMIGTLFSLGAGVAEPGEQELYDNLSALHGQLRATGDQHHLLQNKFAHFFTAAGFDVNVVTIFVDSSAHLAIGAITDAAWENKFTRLATKIRLLSEQDLDDLSKPASDISQKLIGYISSHKKVVQTDLAEQFVKNIYNLGLRQKDLKDVTGYYRGAIKGDLVDAHWIVNRLGVMEMEYKG